MSGDFWHSFSCEKTPYGSYSKILEHLNQLESCRFGLFLLQNMGIACSFYSIHIFLCDNFFKNWIEPSTCFLYTVYTHEVQKILKKIVNQFFFSALIKNTGKKAVYDNLRKNRGLDWKKRIRDKDDWIGGIWLFTEIKRTGLEEYDYLLR